mgnify:CR=1 FL=1
MVRGLGEVVTAGRRRDARVGRTEVRLLPLVGLLGEGLVVRGGRLPLGVGGVLALLLELGLVLPLCRLVLPRLLVPVGRGGARGLCVNRRGLVGGQLRGGPVRGQLLGVLRVFRPAGTGQGWEASAP